MGGGGLSGSHRVNLNKSLVWTWDPQSPWHLVCKVKGWDSQSQDPFQFQLRFPKCLKNLTANVAAAAAKSLQLCQTLCNPRDGSPPGSPVPGILQARTLEWVAISFSNAWKWKVKVKSLSRVRLLATPWTAAHQAPPSMGFSRKECWSGVPLPSLLQYMGAYI